MCFNSIKTKKTYYFVLFQRMPFYFKVLYYFKSLSIYCNVHFSSPFSFFFSFAYAKISVLSILLLRDVRKTSYESLLISLQIFLSLACQCCLNAIYFLGSQARNLMSVCSFSFVTNTFCLEAYNIFFFLSLGFKHFIIICIDVVFYKSVLFKFSEHF